MERNQTLRDEGRVAAARRRLLEHPIYASVNSVDQLRRFMSLHAFAVWDFMSLVKRLQRELTTTTVPWTPPRHPRLARFVNEIVLDEESDRDPAGEPCSHFELYLRAMEEVGADASAIRGFVDALASGSEIAEAIARPGIPPSVRHFVTETVDVSRYGSTIDVAACFLFAREDLIPEMFRRFADGWPDGRAVAPTFLYYLERHVELDGDHHSELARELLDTLSREAGPAKTERALDRACRAIRSRERLWDAALEFLHGDGRRPKSVSDPRDLARS